MKAFLFKGTLFLLPLLVWEIALRLTPPRAPVFYGDAEALAKQSKVDFIFIGSSRVAAAIDADRFESVVEKRLGHPVRALNLGMGYSTWAEHTLALKRLFERYPEHLRGTTVFIETLQGIGSPDRWQASWTHEGLPDLLIPVLSAADLLRFWTVSGSSREDKSYVTAGWLSRVVVEMVRWRRKFLAEGNVAISDYLDKLQHGAPKQQADLGTAGGVRTDDAGITIARNLALKLAAEQLKDQQPIRSFEGGILRELTQLITERGGSVLFVAMPMSSVEAGPWQTAQRQAERQVFQKVASGWGALDLPVAFATEDADFPDLWHLRHSRRQAYTESLANAYLDRISLRVEAIRKD